jgi:hypothetical protein
MLLPNLIPLIDVTFSTPTGHYTHSADRPYFGRITSKQEGTELLLVCRQIRRYQIRVGVFILQMAPSQRTFHFE